MNDHYLQRRCRNIYSNFQENRWGFSFICLAILGLGGFYVGIQSVAIFTTGIISGSFGLSTSPVCGQWMPFSNASKSSTATIEDEHEAIAYAESYYSKSLFRTPGTEYVRRKIDFKSYQDEPCPFPHSYCVSNNSTLVLDSGMQSSRILGVNTAEEYFVRKRLDCAPLISQNLKKVFIQVES